MRVRIRRIAKWGCLSIGGVMLIAAVVGYWWDAGCGRWLPIGRSGPAVNFNTITNRLVIAWYSYYNESFGDAYSWSRRTSGPIRFWPRLYYGNGIFEVTTPTSNLALVTLGAGVVLWRLDRRRAAYQCPKCGYDRRGLAEGAVCPECGTAALAAPERTA